ncbi:putative SET and MYND domain-containing protein [Naja naja]|nr:putative SET and MYND domain-containing protein [Naja naja]
MAAPSGDPFAFCLEAPPGQARRALELRLTGSAKGKGLFATRNIRKGDMIFVEKPVVSAQFLWNALYKYRACDHCLRALETAEENAQRLLGRFQILPHPENAAFKKTSISAVPAARNIHYPPETSSIMLMARMVATVKQVRIWAVPRQRGRGFRRLTILGMQLVLESRPQFSPGFLLLRETVAKSVSFGH